VTKAPSALADDGILFPVTEVFPCIDYSRVIVYENLFGMIPLR
jgi:hypothetical protein